MVSATNVTTRSDLNRLTICGLRRVGRRRFNYSNHFTIIVTQFEFKVIT